MDPIVHRGRSITLHHHGSVVFEVRIDGHFVHRLARPADEVIEQVCSVIDRIDAHPEEFRLMQPWWYRVDDPRRLEAKGFHGVPLHAPIVSRIDPAG